MTALVNAACDGDAEAFATLVASHRRALHLHCYRLLGTHRAADDALDRSLLRAWRGLRGFRGQAPLRDWLLRFATTTCVQRPVSGAVEPYPEALLAGLSTADSDPAANAGGRATLAVSFVLALRHLPARQRAVLVLHDVLGWPADDVARALGVPATTVDLAVRRGRETLEAFETVPEADRRTDPLTGTDG
jgi:RNA polymerase sigma-70 factor (ECF subfamily)